MVADTGEPVSGNASDPVATETGVADEGRVSSAGCLPGSGVAESDGFAKNRVSSAETVAPESGPVVADARASVSGNEAGSDTRQIGASDQDCGSFAQPEDAAAPVADSGISPDLDSNISNGLFPPAVNVDRDDTPDGQERESGCAAVGVVGMVGSADLAVLLAGLDLETVSAAGLVDTAAGWERVIAWATAQQLVVLAEAARPGRVAALDSCVAMAEARMIPLHFDDVAKADPESAASVIAEEAIKITAATINPIIGATRQATTDRISVGIDLTRQLPATFAALSEGRCDYYRALMISRTTLLMNPDARAKADTVLAAAVAAGQNSGKLRHTIDKTIAKLDPVTFANRHHRAIAGRNVTYRPGSDGMGIITATLRAEDAITIYHYLSALGHNAAEADQGCPDPLPDQHHTTNPSPSGSDSGTNDSRGTDCGGVEVLEPRTPGACRADALVDLVNTLINTESGSHRDTDSGSTDNGCTNTEVTDDGSADTGDDEDASCADTANAAGAVLPALRRALPRLNITISLDTLAQITDDPAWLDSYGYLPADYARHLAASAATITVIALDNCGTVLDQGTAIRIPNRKLKSHIYQRDRTCRAPGCNQPANKSDLDHQVPFRPDHTGGPTCGCNMAALCRTHHLLKHRTGVTITHHPDHTITWKTPTGHTLTTQPHQWADTNDPPEPDPYDGTPPY